MEIQKSEAIVLSSRLIGEADLLAQILTKEYGKRTFVFKGLKKSKKRAKSAAEPGTTLNISYYYKEHKNSSIINDFQIVSNLNNIRNNLSHILNLHFIIETVLKTTGENDKQLYLYKLLSAAINTLENTNFPFHLSFFFLIHLIKFHGILPSISHCGNCGTTNINDFKILPEKHIILCSNCARQNNIHSHILEAANYQYIRKCLANKFLTIEHSKISLNNIHQLLFHISLFLEEYFHINLKSKELLFQDLD